MYYLFICFIHTISEVYRQVMQYAHIIYKTVNIIQDKPSFIAETMYYELVRHLDMYIT